MSLERYFDHRVVRECAVNIVKLISVCGPDREGNTQVITSFAGPHLNGGRVKAGVELFGDLSHGFCKTIHPCPHHFDGEVTGVFNQRLFSGVAWNGGEGGGTHVVSLYQGQI